MRSLLFFGALALAGLGFVACTSDSESEPPNTFKVDAGADTGVSVVDSGSPDVDVPETVADSGADTAGCVGDGGCFGCKPTTNDQFLNRCSGSQCSKFDDKTRIPSSVWDGGALPAVP